VAFAKALKAQDFLCFLWPFLPFFLVSIILSMLKDEVADTLLKLVAADTGVAAWLDMAAKAVVMAINSVFMVRSL